MSDFKLKVNILSGIYLAYLLVALFWVALGGTISNMLAIIIIVIYVVEMIIPIVCIIIVNKSVLKTMSRELRNKYKNNFIFAFGFLTTTSLVQALLAIILYANADTEKKNYEAVYEPPIYLAAIGLIMGFVFTIVISI